MRYWLVKVRFDWLTLVRVNHDTFNTLSGRCNMGTVLPCAGGG